MLLVGVWACKYIIYHEQSSKILRFCLKTDVVWGCLRIDGGIIINQVMESWHI